MKKIVYNFSIFIALISFIVNTLSGTALLTSLFRSIVVFVLMLFIIAVTLKILHWTLMLSKNAPKDNVVEKKNN